MLRRACAYDGGMPFLVLPLTHSAPHACCFSRLPLFVHRYLCSEAGQQPNLGQCEVSADFTKHYGQTVYVCQGGAVNDLHGGICKLAA